MYINESTFWLVAIGLCIAIAIVYNVLNGKIKKNEQDIQAIVKTIQGMANIIDEEFVKVRNESHRANAKIYGDVADVLDDLTKKTERIAKKKK